MFTLPIYGTFQAKNTQTFFNNDNQFVTILFRAVVTHCEIVTHKGRSREFSCKLLSLELTGVIGVRF